MEAQMTESPRTTSKPPRERHDVPSLPMDIHAIQQCIPHRHPFLLVDRVLEASPNERIVAVKNVSIGEPVLQGHFPGNPVMPGVYIIEGIAQAAAVLGHLSYENGLTTCYLTEVSSARFRRPVVPGDVLRYEVTVLKRRAPFFWFDAIATVDGETVAEVKLSAFIK
jgi:beta-hydroxyacyl-ACP dehydratase FabZ